MNEHKTKMNKLIVLVIGNIGTGKTTFISNLNIRKHRAIVINDNYPDANSPDFSMAVNNAILENNTIVIEGNYTSRFWRLQVILPIRSYYQDISFICFDFGPGNKNSLRYRLEDTHMDSLKTIETHNKYKEEYCKPELNEGFSRIIKCYD